jgi:RNA polymerase sigma-70 factor (ECF subfamily)
VLAWVYAIARYKLIDAFRRRGRRIEVEIDEIADSIAAPEPETLSERDLNRALDTLPPGQRSVVSAISVDGRSISETAGKLGMSEVAVRVALHRGLQARVPISWRPRTRCVSCSSSSSRQAWR